MKTMRNRLVLSLATVLMIALAAFAVFNFRGGEIIVKAADSGSFGGSTLRLDVVDTAAQYDYVSFEYKFDSVDNANRIQFVITESGDTNCYGFFIFDQNGGTNSYVGVTTEILDDGYVKVTLKMADVATIRGNGATNYKQIMFYKNGVRSAVGLGTIRNASFYNEPEPEPDPEPEGTIFEMVNDATVRLSAPYGIKFRAHVPTEFAEDSDVTYGMTIIPYEWLTIYASEIEAANGDYIAVLDNAGVNYRKYNCTPVQEGEDYYIQASLTNIKKENVGKQFIGIAWYEKADIKTYAVNKDCACSIKDVSVKAIIADGQYEEEQSAFLNDIAGRKDYTAGDKLTVATLEKAIRGEDYLVFYYKKSAAGTVNFAVINSDDWGGYYGYFEISNDNTINADGVTVTAVENEWYKVTLDVTKMTVKHHDPSEFTTFDTIYFKDATASFEVMGLGVEARPAHADQKEFTAGVDFALDLETAAYTSVSFDYQITSGEKFDLAILLNWTDGYGYFSFYETGCTEEGVTCMNSDDGYIHVEIDLTKTTKAIGSGADSFNLFRIKGKNTTASGYIDNIQFAL